MTSTKNTLRPARLFTLLLALMLIGSTAACTEEPVEYFTPPPSTPTPTPVVDDVPEVFERPSLYGVAPPYYPQAANEVSEDGARAFAYYFLEVLNYTAATGDVTHLEKLSGPECTFCQGFLSVNEQVNNSDQWIEGYEITYLTDPTLERTNGTVFAFLTSANSAEYKVLGSSGEVGSRHETVLNGALVLYRIGNHWLVEDFREVSEK